MRRHLQRKGCNGDAEGGGMWSGYNMSRTVSWERKSSWRTKLFVSRGGKVCEFVLDRQSPMNGYICIVVVWFSETEVACRHLGKCIWDVINELEEGSTTIFVPVFRILCIFGSHQGSSSTSPTACRTGRSDRPSRRRLSVHPRDQRDPRVLLPHSISVMETTRW